MVAPIYTNYTNILSAYGINNIQQVEKSYGVQAQAAITENSLNSLDERVEISDTAMNLLGSEQLGITNNQRTEIQTMEMLSKASIQKSILENTMNFGKSEQLDFIQDMLLQKYEENNSEIINETLYSTEDINVEKNELPYLQENNPSFENIQGGSKYLNYLIKPIYTNDNQYNK